MADDRYKRYRSSQKYKDWLKKYMSENKDRLRDNVRRWRSKPETKIKENARQVQYRQTLKKLIYKKYGNECKCCGEQNLIFLTIDHVNNDGYLERDPSGKRTGGRSLYNKIIAEDYPDRFQLLCMNCNFGKSINKGICPHRLEENG